MSTGWSRTGQSDAIGFVSTRSRSAAPVSFEVAMRTGLAPDGGLYLPTEIPRLAQGWHSAANLAELAAMALPRLLGLGASEVEELFAAALDFPLEVRPLAGERYLLELFHGPTAAFKDFGARSLARLLDRSLAARGEQALVLVATSGDTGSAVAAAFSGLTQIRVALLYPAGRVSPVQERQLIARRDGVTAFAIQGNFDDCQRLVKEAFADPSLRDLGLSSANSINVARLLPQTLYHLWGVMRAEQLGARTGAVKVVVPSGNLGNLTSGLIASRMGSGAHEFVAAHNVNDYYPRYLAGATAAYDFAATRQTVSNAMDVGAPSNFERLVALGTEGAERITGASVSDAETLEEIRLTYQSVGYLACPHTAVGLRAWRRLSEAGATRAPALLLATAHPGKFPEIVAQALATGAAGPAASWRKELELPGESPAAGVSVRLEPRLADLRDALRAL